MPKVTFKLKDGGERVVDAELGWKLMEVATNASVPGIDGDCGGQAACATCHVYVPDEWKSITGDRTPNEEAMLENTWDVQENSRLCCQIEVTEALDGLSVEVVGS